MQRKDSIRKYDSWVEGFYMVKILLELILLLKEYSKEQVTLGERLSRAKIHVVLQRNDSIRKRVLCG